MRTEPAGARVRINGEDVGTSPLSWRFHHYGDVLVEAEYPGHEPVQRVVTLRTPWYQQPGLDFVTDVLSPARIKDEHSVLLRLAPEAEPTDAQKDRQIERLVANARALKRRARNLESADEKRKAAGR